MDERHADENYRDVSELLMAGGVTYSQQPASEVTPEGNGGVWRSVLNTQWCVMVPVPTWEVAGSWSPLLLSRDGGGMRDRMRG